MLLVISSAKFRLQKYSYFLQLQKIIAVFYIKDFGTMIDNMNTACSAAEQDGHI
jgi:hypothetical protein